MTTDTNHSDLMRAALQETAAVLEMGDAFPGLLKMVKRALAAPAQPAAKAQEAQVLMRVIQRLNQNPYSLTKSECISEIGAMRDAAIAAQQGGANG